jgi:hypothetical protein
MLLYIYRIAFVNLQALLNQDLHLSLLWVVIIFKYFSSFLPPYLWFFEVSSSNNSSRFIVLLLFFGFTRTSDYVGSLLVGGY